MNKLTRSFASAVAARKIETDLSHRHQALQPFSSIPGPRPLPVIGNIWRYLPLVGQYKIDQLHKNAKLNRRIYGPIVREQITSNHTILHLFDPADVEAFFRQDGHEPHRRSHRALLKYRRDRREHYNDGGLFPENGATWLRIRKLFQQSLMKKSELAKRAQILDEIAVDAVHNLKDHKIVENFQEFLYDWSIKSSLAVFLDFSSSDMPSVETRRALIESLHKELEAIDGTEIKSDRWIERPNRCPFFQKLSAAEETMRSFVAERIDRLIETRNMPSQRTSFVRRWLFHDRLDRKDVTTFILDSILAGLHTTAYTTTFLLYHLSSWNPEKFDQLRRQARDCMPPPSVTLVADPSESMPTLRDCLRESQRLKPISIGTGRLTQSEMVIRNYLVPKDVMVIAHNQVICMDASIYEQPERFYPERWAQYRERPRAQRPSAFAWLPYGFGARACIGQRLITMQIHILASRFMQQYNWKFIDHVKTKSILVHTLDGNIKVELNRL